MKTIRQELSHKQDAPFILFVDDDHEDQVFLKMAFDSTNKNCSLHFVSTGKEALDYLQLRQNHKLPDLIVLDYHLPGINGLSLMQQLNTDERFNEIEKVILSTSSISYLSRYSLCNEPVEHFTKPCSFQELKELAHELLDMCSSRLCNA
jgi:CheY-like chemotaxis protein